MNSLRIRCQLYLYNIIGNGIYGRIFDNDELGDDKLFDDNVIVSVFLLLGYELDFSENIISRKNIVIMILSAVAIILYDEFGWGVFPSNYYEFDVYEKKGLSEHWCDTCQEDNKK